MKRIILAILVLFTSNLYANESSFFGIDINRNLNMYDSNSEKQYDTGATVKAGSISNDRRHYISYSRPQDKNNIKYENVLYNYDLLLEKQKEIIPYIGVHAGLGILHFNNQKQETFDFGLKVGFIYEIFEDSNIDFGFKISNTNDVYIGNIKLKQTQNFYIGYGISFEDLLY